MASVIKQAIGDGILTFMWVFYASTMGPVTVVISTALGIQGIAAFLITATLLFFLLVVFGAIGNFLGGASFNPTGNAGFYAAGVGDDSLISAAVRFPAQAAGAVGGALAIAKVMPVEYRDMLGGPSLKVDMHTGAIAEGVLTFIATFMVLLIILKVPANILVKNLMLCVSIITLVVFGSDYTGPSMNPAIAFGWAFVDNKHNTSEHFYVYWICPFVGAILAGWVFRFLFPMPSKSAMAKQEKLKEKKKN